MKRVLILAISLIVCFNLLYSANRIESVEDESPYWFDGTATSFNVYVYLDAALGQNQTLVAGASSDDLLDAYWCDSNYYTDESNSANNYWCYLLNITINQNNTQQIRSNNITIELTTLDSVTFSDDINSVNQYPIAFNHVDLQGYVNNASDGSTVYIPEGIYDGSVVINGRNNLIIKGASNHNTIVRGINLNPVLKIMNSTNITLENLTITNGNSISGSGIYIDDYSLLIPTPSQILVNNCIITRNHAYQPGGLIVDNNGTGLYAGENTKVTISSSIFYDNGNNCSYGNSIYNKSNYDMELDHCNFLQDTTGDDFYIDPYSNSSFNFIDCILKNEVNTAIGSATYTNCCLYNAGSLPGTGNISTNTPMFKNEADNDYRLIPGSPLIASGSGNIVADLEIDDLTNDIGAIQNDLDRYVSYSFKAGHNWMSFPVIDNYPMSNSIMANFFGEYDDFGSPMQSIKYQGYVNQTFYDLTLLHNNLSTNVHIESTKGYKFRFSINSQMTKFHGYHADYNTLVEVENAGIETWIGYFIPQTQTIEDAFGEYLANVYYIKHKDWTLARQRPRPDSPWIKTSGTDYTISYGEMVSVKRFSDTDSSFTWKYIAPATHYTRTPTTYFSYQEEADYTPIFVEVDASQNFKEVAVFVNDECKGAAVVEDELVMVPGYITDLENGVELELRAWDESKSSKKMSFNLFNHNSSDFEPTNSIIKSDNDFYQVKLGSGSLDSDIETPTSLAINNYPNPFNPETTISFNNPKSGNVSLAIYNIKGQLVKTLLDEDVSTGAHSIVWNGKNEIGKAVSSGVYFTKIKTGTVTKIKKMILMK